MNLRGRPASRYGVGEASVLGSGAEQLDDQTHEFILSEITRNILEQTPVIFGTIKEGIMELVEERFGYFRSEIVALIGTRLLEPEN